MVWMCDELLSMQSSCSRTLGLCISSSHRRDFVFVSVTRRARMMLRDFTIPTLCERCINPPHLMPSDASRLPFSWIYSPPLSPSMHSHRL